MHLLDAILQKLWTRMRSMITTCTWRGPPYCIHHSYLKSQRVWSQLSQHTREYTHTIAKRTKNVLRMLTSSVINTNCIPCALKWKGPLSYMGVAINNVFLQTMQFCEQVWGRDDWDAGTMNIHTHMHTHACTHIHTHTNTCTCIYAHPHIHTYIHVYMHMHICTFTHTCTHKYARTCTTIEKQLIQMFVWSLLLAAPCTQPTKTISTSAVHEELLLP